MHKNLQLELHEHFLIRDVTSGLNKTSVLALNRSGSKLYTVIDDAKVIFNLNLQGKIIANTSFLIELKDLEGLAVTSDDKEIIAVHESSNSVVHFDIINKKEIRRTSLSAMKNYDQIVNHFRNDDRNKGLEGITINFNNDHIFIVKEGKPGILIELDSECKKILDCCELTEECGYKHRRLKSKKFDFSGLYYDHFRDAI